MDDYYSLQAVFAALDRSDREFDADPVVARQRQFLQERKTQLTANLSALQERIRQKAGEPLRKVEASIQTLERPLPADQMPTVTTVRSPMCPMLKSGCRWIWVPSKGSSRCVFGAVKMISMALVQALVSSQVSY